MQRHQSWEAIGGPEVEVVNGALLIPHVDVEREQIDGRKRSPTKDFEERWQTVPSQVGLGRRRRRAVVVVVVGHFECSQNEEVG